MDPRNLFNRSSRRGGHKANSEGKRHGKRSVLAVMAVATALVVGLCAPGFAGAEENDEGQEQSIAAQQVTVADLTDVRNVSSDTYVTFTGEVVGEIVKGDRPGYSWISVSAGGEVIGVFLPNELTDEISYTGDYRTTGDTVTVTGIYHSDCTDGHEGELDVHANAVEVVSVGSDRTITPAPNGQWAAGVILTSAAFVLLYLYESRKRRRHRTS